MAAPQNIPSIKSQYLNTAYAGVHKGGQDELKKKVDTFCQKLLNTTYFRSLCSSIGIQNPTSITSAGNFLFINDKMLPIGPELGPHAPILVEIAKALQNPNSPVIDLDQVEAAFKAQQKKEMDKQEPAKTSDPAPKDAPLPQPQNPNPAPNSPTGTVPTNSPPAPQQTPLPAPMSGNSLPDEKYKELLEQLKEQKELLNKARQDDVKRKELEPQRQALERAQMQFALAENDYEHYLAELNQMKALLESTFTSLRNLPLTTPIFRGRHGAAAAAPVAGALGPGGPLNRNARMYRTFLGGMTRAKNAIDPLIACVQAKRTNLNEHSERITQFLNQIKPGVQANILNPFWADQQRLNRTEKTYIRNCETLVAHLPKLLTSAEQIVNRYNQAKTALDVAKTAFDTAQGAPAAATASAIKEMGERERLTASVIGAGLGFVADQITGMNLFTPLGSALAPGSWNWAKKKMTSTTYSPTYAFIAGCVLASAATSYGPIVAPLAAEYVKSTLLNVKNLRNLA